MESLRQPAVEPEPANAGARVEQLYAEHVAMVWSGLRRLGVPESSIEDAVQDVFLVAHRRLIDFEGRSSIKTWLYGIVLRVAKDYRRAQVRHAQRVERLAEILSVDSAAAQTPVKEAERREANRALHSILAELDEDHREVLVLVELEELSVRDAADVLHLHVRSCQRRLRAAHAAFEKKLARYLQPSGRHTP
jgi:RNA polymerase sigma-70 factor (ECF subfamily)